jgi:hypothetical protein
MASALTTLGEAQVMGDGAGIVFSQQQLALLQIFQVILH